MEVDGRWPPLQVLGRDTSSPSEESRSAGVLGGSPSRTRALSGWNRIRHVTQESTIFLESATQQNPSHEDQPGRVYSKHPDEELSS